MTSKLKIIMKQSLTNREMTKLSICKQNPWPKEIELIWKTKQSLRDRTTKSEVEIFKVKSNFEMQIW